MTDARIVLTDEEWMSIIDRERDGLPHCCANVSELRSTLIAIARDSGEVTFLRDSLAMAWGWVFADDQHGEPTPVMKKIAEQLDLTGYTDAVTKIRHETDGNQAEFLARARATTENTVTSAIGTLQDLLKDLRG